MTTVDLFRTFTAVRNLYLSEELGLHVAPVRQGLSEETIPEVFNNLRCMPFS